MAIGRATRSRPYGGDDCPGLADPLFKSPWSCWRQPVLLAALGPWVMPLFVSDSDPQAAEVVKLGLVLLWIAAGYQLFDGLQLGSGFALRGAGDVRVPALIFLGLSWGVFVPLAHMLSFAPGQGWFDLLPQFGLGAVGGWFGLLSYVVLLAVGMLWRWRSGRWQQIRI